MANITIPNLPVTASTINNDIFVITDAAGTTTSQIKKSDMLKNINTTGVLTTTNQTQTIISSKTSSITQSKENSVIIGSENSDITANDSFARSNVIIGAIGADILSNASIANVIIGGNTNSINDGSYGAIIASRNVVSTGIGNPRGVYSSFDVDTYGAANTFIGSYTSEDCSISLNVGSGILLGAANSAINSNKSTGGASTSNDINYWNTSIVSSNNSFIVGNTSTTYRNVGIYNSDNVEVNGKNNVVVLASTGYTATADNIVVVPQLVMTEYSSLNYSGDTAAAAGGVVLGGLYHDNGALRVRIS